MGKKVEVTITEGTLRGMLSKDYHDGVFYSFIGIPYAKPPIGELRFKAPEPVEPWKGVKNATKVGAESPQYMKIMMGKEDNCLNLNVFTKELSQGLKKPVMVFIHGGGFVSGSSRPDLIYGPEFLMTEDIVLVTINYRLGILGFLSLTDRSLNVPGNAGMKDQVMALKWVQKNIKYFGGDPNNVTIFGESAGGAAVHFLVVSPLAKGLFHKAICQSGCVLNPWATGVPNGVEVAKAMGYRSDASEDYILKRLKSASVSRIMKGQNKFQMNFNPNHVRTVSVVVEYPHEGAFLTQHPLEILKAGKQNQVPMIMGYNSLEGLFFELVGRICTFPYCRLPNSMESDIPHNCDVDPTNTKLVDKAANDIKSFYYKDEKVSKRNKQIRYLITNDTVFMYGIQKSIQLHKKTGSTPIYAYRMSIESDLNVCKKFAQAKSPTFFTCIFGISLLTGSSGIGKIATSMKLHNLPGVCHADDLFYLFKANHLGKIQKDSELDKWIQRFVKLWTNFARTGNPTPAPGSDLVLERAVWKPVGSTDIDFIFNIDHGLRCTGLDAAEMERMKFWNKYHTNFGV
ncbi:unnamed protein product [Acanthoscelides obtectus]|uniref:Carboxylic ester hydrolase n=1 Tax=Acanthoscelides obtectus TaxID=200917 RepID=A0A9P0JKR7_ACAOB|nr:unnamed protein product [Acanthoscelides obtectus]CAK1657996.1 hypothetical protein AOBTE_LOCUS20645 [Acanthoscelides obtectus]